MSATPSPKTPSRHGHIKTGNQAQPFEESQETNTFSLLAPEQGRDEPRSPFASLTSTQSQTQGMSGSRSLPVPINRASLLKSNSFGSRQLSFQDWCLNPSISAEQKIREKSSSQRSPQSQASELDLKPKDCPLPDSTRMSRADTSAIDLDATTIAPEPILASHMSAKGSERLQRELSSLDLDDLLSCKETLSVSQSTDYGAPSPKRRRSCYAF